MDKSEEIFLGYFSEVFKDCKSEEELDAAFLALGKKWHDQGYFVASGKVSEGKVDELWAVPQGKWEKDKNEQGAKS
jgi:hypothetical protein